MSYGFGFGFPRLASLAAAGSPFATLGPTLDLNFVGTGSSSGVPGDNDSLNLDFIGNTYQVGTQYSVWTSGGLQPENFQDIVTYSRSTTNATYYNSSGYLTTTGILNYLTYSNTPENAAWTKSNSFIQTNLLTYSQTFNTGWGPNNIQAFGSGSIADAIVAPDGTLTADLISNAAAPGVDFHYVAQGITLSQNTTYTLSVYAKAGPVGSGIIWLLGNAALDIFCYFNLNTGTVGTTTNFISASIQNVGGGWYRCVASFTNTAVTGAQSIGFGLAQVNGTPSWNSVGLAGTQQAYIWGAQLVQGAVPGNYQATTAAALPVLYPDYNGALRARKFSEDAVTIVHYMYQGGISAGTYTLSVYAKQGERTRFAMGNATAGDYAYFNLATGVVTNAGTGTASGGTMFSVGNGWYRCSVVCNVGVTWPAGILVLDAAGSITYAGDGSSGIYLTDMQVEVGTTVGPYYETTQYRYNAPRFDYDPVTLQPRGLLIEELRTNLLLQSNDFQTSWLLTNITRTLANTTSPEGVLNGVKIEATATAGAFATQLRQSAVVAATSATGSVYVKQGTSATKANEFLIRNSTTATDLIAGTLNYSTGVFTYTTGSTGVVVTNVGNGWWRISVTATAGITAGDAILWYVGWVGAVATAGDFLYAYGAQLEAGAFATSYIATVASQVTRAADAASVNTMTPWFNPSAGALYAEFATYGYSTLFYPCAAQIGFNGVGSRGYIHVINGPTATTSFNVFDDASVYQGPSSSVAYVTGAIRKQVGAYRVNDAAGTADGVAAVTDTSVTLPTNLNVLTIGCYANFGSQNQINGWVRRVTYYPRRLSNAELQSITTL